MYELLEQYLILRNEKNTQKSANFPPEKYTYIISTYIYCVKNCFPIYLQT